MSSLLRRFDEVLCSVLGRIVALASNALAVLITRTGDVSGGLRQSGLIEILWQGGQKRLQTSVLHIVAKLDACQPLFVRVHRLC